MATPPRRPATATARYSGNSGAVGAAAVLGMSLGAAAAPSSTFIASPKGLPQAYPKAPTATALQQLTLPFREHGFVA
jgi:hypothetical protein